MTGAKAPSRLVELARLATDADNDSVARRAAELAERVAGGRYYVACVGQFKRGKSTLVNALTGAAILPAGVAPVTSVVTVVRFGAERQARVQGANRGWSDVPAADLAAFVGQDANPDNTKGVLAVEVFTPSPLLELGMCLVDTPGLGSVFTVNTATTRAFVPHVDAALVVLGGDPPISASELELVGELAREVDELVFVMNKADRLSESERRDARRFTEDTLRRRLGDGERRIFEVSAIERLAGDPGFGDWNALHEELGALARRAGVAMVERAEERGTHRLVAELDHDLDHRRNALTRPVAESEARIAVLARCVADARLALRDLRYLFDGEQHAVLAAVAARTAEFLGAKLPALSTELASGLAAGSDPSAAAFRARSFTLAQDLVRGAIQDWLRGIEPEAKTLYRAAADRFVAIANEFLERLARAQPELAAACQPLEPELDFRVRSRFFQHEHLHLTGRSPLDWLADRFRSDDEIRRAAVRRADRYVRRVARTNASRVQNDLARRFLGSRERLERDIERRLDELLGSAVRALERARAILAEGTGARDAELERIEGLRVRAAALA